MEVFIDYRLLACVVRVPQGLKDWFLITGLAV
jgi:hypothetical protein